MRWKCKDIFALSAVLMFMALLCGAVLAGAGDANKGKRQYDQFCVPCHGKSGMGDGTRVNIEKLDPKPRNHTDGAYMNQRTDSELFKVIKNGGFSMNLSHEMPQWKHLLKDSDIWDVVAFVRTLADPPPKSDNNKSVKGAD